MKIRYRYLEDLFPNQMIEYGKILPKSGKKKWIKSLSINLKKDYKNLKNIMKIIIQILELFSLKNEMQKLLIKQTPHEFVKELKTVKDAIKQLRIW